MGFSIIKFYFIISFNNFYIGLKLCLDKRNEGFENIKSIVFMWEEMCLSSFWKIINYCEKVIVIIVGRVFIWILYVYMKEFKYVIRFNGIRWKRRTMYFRLTIYIINNIDLLFIRDEINIF